MGHVFTVAAVDKQKGAPDARVNLDRAHSAGRSGEEPLARAGWVEPRVEDTFRGRGETARDTNDGGFSGFCMHRQPRLTCVGVGPAIPRRAEALRHIGPTLNPSKVK